jgi:thiol-disulfide isomerase/thioredoxin
MKRIRNTYRILCLFYLSFCLLASCGKDSKEYTPKTESKSNVTSSSSYSTIKTSGNSVQKNQSVEFTWSENGKEVKLSDFKGKVILLNFWATWCGPCKREIPALSQISNELKDKNFKLIGVSIDQNPLALDSYLKSNSISYTILHEPGDLLGKYMQASGNDQNVIPQSFIIDKNGKIGEILVGSRSKSDFLALINKYL